MPRGGGVPEHGAELGKDSLAHGLSKMNCEWEFLKYTWGRGGILGQHMSGHADTKELDLWTVDFFFYSIKCETVSGK